MFILELTLRSWIHSEENKRRTLQRNDIAAAITKTDIFDFLVSCSLGLRAAEDQHPTPLQWAIAYTRCMHQTLLLAAWHHVVALHDGA
jgi:hypothetical protein